MGCGPLSVLSDADPQAIGLTYWAEAPADGPPARLEVRFSGRAVDGTSSPAAGDRFEATAVVDPVPAGSGRVAVTTRVSGVRAGQWQVSAQGAYQVGSRREPLPRASGRGATAYAPVLQVRAPGVRLGAWPSMVAVGALVGLAVQAQVAAALGLPVLTLLVLSLVACLIGVVGAKVYYLATHRKEKPGLLMVGMSLQGFVLAALGTVALGSVTLALPLGAALDASAPGLLFGAAIGRIGCFLGGCCAGRPTASRWGLWSSNRRVGVRRIPVQLMDSAAAGALGALAVVLALRVSGSMPGSVFVAALATYIWVRQLLFALRDEPRKTAHGRVMMLVATSLVVLADLALTPGLRFR